MHQVFAHHSKRPPSAASHLRLGAAALLVCSTGCMSRYQQPPANQPHALVSVRRIYYASPPFAGETRWERVLLDDEVLTSQAAAAWPDGLNSKEVRVRPGPLRVKFSVQFSHFEQRPVQQQVVAAKSNEREDSRGRQQRTEVKTVYAPVEVQDDRCDAEALPSIVPQRAYLLQYEYFGYASCRLICLERAPQDAEPRPCGTR